MKKDKKFFIYTSLVILETLVLIYLSFQPSIVVVRPEILIRIGDIEHFITYSIYGFLLQRTFRYFFQSTRMTIISSFMVGCMVGGLSETIQHFIPYREADMIDWIVDSIGSLFGSYTTSKFMK